MSVFPENAAASGKQQFRKTNSKHFIQFFLERPIDLLPCAGVQLSRYLGTWTNQHRQFAPMYVSTGFIFARSSTSVFLNRLSHALNYFVEHIESLISKKQHALGVFNDLLKAFDTLDHCKHAFHTIVSSGH